MQDTFSPLADLSAYPHLTAAAVQFALAHPGNPFGNACANITATDMVSDIWVTAAAQ